MEVDRAAAVVHCLHVVLSRIAPMKVMSPSLTSAFHVSVDCRVCLGCLSCVHVRRCLLGIAFSFFFFAAAEGRHPKFRSRALSTRSPLRALLFARTAMAGPFPFSARASSRRCPSFNCCDRAAPRSQAQPSPLPPPRCPAVAEPTTARAWSTARAPALDRVSKAALTSCRAAPPPVRRVCSAAPHVPRAPRALPCHSVSAAASSFLRLPRARVAWVLWATAGHAVGACVHGRARRCLAAIFPLLPCSPGRD